MKKEALILMQSKDISDCQFLPCRLCPHWELLDGCPFILVRREKAKIEIGNAVKRIMKQIKKDKAGRSITASIPRRLIRECADCKDWKTARCWERKQTGKDSGPRDWCAGCRKK